MIESEQERDIGDGNGFEGEVGKKKIPFANTGSVGFRFEFFTNYDNT